MPDFIPAKATKADVGDDAEEDDEEDGDEDEFQVEEVLDHKTSRGQIIYQIKWLGYDQDEDLTWEPVENLYEHCTGPFWLLGLTSH